MSPNLVTDSNGNQIAFTAGVSPLTMLTFMEPGGGTDTLGRAMPPLADTGADPGGCVSGRPILSTFVFNYNAPDGTVRKAKLCTADIPIQTAFNVSGVNEAATGVDGLDFAGVVSIVLADGNRWSFDYDNYGELIYVGLPTGGSISYTWQTIDFSSCGSFSPLSRAVVTRTLVDAQGNSAVWNYHWGASSTTAITNFVTDPAQNDTVHSFTAQGSCNLMETSTLEYQGSQSAGTLLRRTDTAYSHALITVDTGGSAAANVFATDITTTVYPSGKVKKVHRDPDPGPGGGLPDFWQCNQRTGV